MKKMIASAGLLALGAAGAHAAYIPGFTSTDKNWSVSATLRGFYDDNYVYASGGSSDPARDSFGFEVSPTVSVGLPREQTAVGARYGYSMRWYEDRVKNSADHVHRFDGFLNHTFSERYSADVSDSFVVAQEPELLDPTVRTAIRRADGSNIRNLGTITFRGEVTRLLGFEVGYANTLYDFEDSGAIVRSVGPFPVSVEASRSGLLDRLEHQAHIDGRWRLLPETVGVVGYQFGQVNYTADEPISVLTSTFPATILKSDVRDSRSHYGYVGVEHTFRPDLTGSARAGVIYREFYNDPSGSDSLSPYAAVNLRYLYTVASFVELGFTHSRNQTDYIDLSGGSVTTDQESSTLFASINHRITPKLFGSVIGQYQQSTFQGGSVNDVSEAYYGVGLNLEYRFNPHFAAHVGYNYDNVDSDVGVVNFARRGYERNRVYMGVTASY